MCTTASKTRVPAKKGYMFGCDIIACASLQRLHELYMSENSNFEF